MTGNDDNHSKEHRLVRFSLTTVSSGGGSPKTFSLQQLLDGLTECAQSIGASPEEIPVVVQNVFDSELTYRVEGLEFDLELTDVHNDATVLLLISEFDDDEILNELDCQETEDGMHVFVKGKIEVIDGVTYLECTRCHHMIPADDHL